jgi:hypothetical protein
MADRGEHSALDTQSICRDQASCAALEQESTGCTGSKDRGGWHILFAIDTSVHCVQLLLPFAYHPITSCRGASRIFSGLLTLARAFQNVRYPIVPAIAQQMSAGNGPEDGPYGTKLMMRHYSQILPRDFDISPNFEIIKYNIMELKEFNYHSLWIE